MTWKTKGVPESYFLIISMGINVAWISSPVSPLLSVQHAAWENTSKIQLPTEGALPPFAEDAPKDNFSRRPWLSCSRSHPRSVLPSFSSCFLTQNSWASLWGSMFQCCWEPGVYVQQLCYVWGGSSGAVFWQSFFFLPVIPHLRYSFLFLCPPVFSFSSTSNRANL